MSGPLTPQYSRHLPNARESASIAPAMTSIFQTRSRRKKKRENVSTCIRCINQTEKSPLVLCLHLIGHNSVKWLLQSEWEARKCVYSCVLKNKMCLSCALCYPKQNCSSGKKTLTLGWLSTINSLPSPYSSLGMGWTSLLPTYWNLIRISPLPGSLFRLSQ